MRGSQRYQNYDALSCYNKKTLASDYAKENVFKNLHDIVCIP